MRYGPITPDMQQSAPTRPPEKANVDSVEAMTMSEASAISAPAPEAGPSTNEMTGFSLLKNWSQNGLTSPSTNSFASALDSNPPPSLTSSPAENAFPAPVIS